MPKQHRVHQELHGGHRRGVQAGGRLGLPEQPPPHGPRRAQRQGDHDPEDRGDGLGDYTRNVGYKTGVHHLRVRDEGRSTTTAASSCSRTSWTSRRRASSTASWRRAPSSSARRWRRRRDAFTFSEIAGARGRDAP